MADGSKAVGLFNMSGVMDQKITVTWEELGIEGKQTVRDLWRQKNVAKSSKKFTTNVPAHGVVLIKITKK